MKTVLLALAFALAILAPGHAAACRRDPHVTMKSSCDSPARWASRHEVRDAELAITTENGNATLILTDEVVAVQLSDRVFHKIDRKLKDKVDDEEDSGALGRAIKSAVLSSVRSLLDHSQECPVRRIENVEYRHDRLVFTTDQGTDLFGDVDVDDRDVMAAFSERDARLFVREFQRVKARRAS
jgi:hypothetical protein